MDIKQILTNFQIQEIASYTKEQLQDFSNEIYDQESKITEFIRKLQDLRSQANRLKWQIEAQEQKEKDQDMAEKMAERGFKVGAIFYIDRHEGIYEVERVDQYHVTFKRRKEGSSWGKNTCQGVNSIDPRLTPLRTQGPYRVGETVERNGREYQVEGYLGYRMLLSYVHNSTKIYNIVQKKDEKTYRSIII